MRGQALDQPPSKHDKAKNKQKNVKLDRLKRRLKLTLRSCARSSSSGPSKNQAVSASPKSTWQFKTRKKKNSIPSQLVNPRSGQTGKPRPSKVSPSRAQTLKVERDGHRRANLVKSIAPVSTGEDDLKLSTLRDSLRSRLHANSSASDVALLTTTCTTSVYAVLTSSTNTALTTSTSSRIQSFTVTCHNAIHTKAPESHPQPLVAQQWNHMMETIEQVARGGAGTSTDHLAPASTANTMNTPALTSVEDKVKDVTEVDKVVKKRPRKTVVKKPKNNGKETVTGIRPKRKRVASLNASAKVHCLLENETRVEYRTAHHSSSSDCSDSSDSSEGSNDSESGDSSSQDERVTRCKSTLPAKTRLKTAKIGGKFQKKKTSKAKTLTVKESPHRVIRTRAVLRKQKMDRLEKKKQSQLAALVDKGGVLPKRMASLNASAIMAASQWAEKCVTSPAKRSSASSSTSKNSEVMGTINDPNPENMLISGSTSELASYPDPSEETREKTGLVKSDHSVTISKVVIDTCSTSPDGTKMLKKSFTSQSYHKGSNTKERRETVTSSITQGSAYNPLGALRSMRLPDQWDSMRPSSPSSPRLDVCTVKIEPERLSESNIRSDSRSPRSSWCPLSSSVAHPNTVERRTSSSTQQSPHLARPTLSYTKQETNQFSPPPLPPPTLHVTPYPHQPQPAPARFAPLHYPPSFPTPASGYQDSLYNPYMSPTHYSDVARYPYPSCLYPGAFSYSPYYCPPPVPPAPPLPSVSVLHSHYIAPMPSAKTVAEAASSVLNVAPLYTQVETRTHASTWFPASRLGTALPAAPYWTFAPPTPGSSSGYGGNCNVPCSCPSSSPACPKNGWAGPMSGEGVGPREDDTTPPPPSRNASVSPRLEASMAASMSEPTPNSEDKESGDDSSVTVTCCKWATKRKKGSASLDNPKKSGKSESGDKEKKKLISRFEDTAKKAKGKILKKKKQNEKLKTKSEKRRIEPKQIKPKETTKNSALPKINEGKLQVGIKVLKQKEKQQPRKIKVKNLASPKAKTAILAKGTELTDGKSEKSSVRMNSDVNCNAMVIGKLTHESAAKPQWSNGWRWEGEPYEAKIYLRNDDVGVTRRCYPAIKHSEGDVIRVRDCVLLRSGPRPKDLPYVAKVAALFENSEDGEMMISVLWYYRPEHTEQGRLPNDLPDEVFASRHRDFTSVACIEDKCYVLTFNEYCRYRKHVRMVGAGLVPPSCVVPSARIGEGYEDLTKRLERWPPLQVAPDRVLVCRKVYDFRQKRILKNPT